MPYCQIFVWRHTGFGVDHFSWAENFLNQWMDFLDTVSDIDILYQQNVQLSLKKCLSN